MAKVEQLFSLTESEVEARLELVGLGPVDRVLIAAAWPVVEPNIQGLTDAFFNYLGRFAEARRLLDSPALLEPLKRLKHDHLREMLGGNYQLGYANARTKMTVLYGAAHLTIPLFLAAHTHMFERLGEVLLAGAQEVGEALAQLAALRKLAAFDLGLVFDGLIFQRIRIISALDEEVKSLLTPILQISEGLLLLPVIGSIDSQRARQLTESMLQGIRDNRARVVVMDLTGVTAVDSAVANHLLLSVAAARIMGATTLVTGLSAEFATTLAKLGVDLSGLRTLGDLQGGLEEAQKLLGYRTVLSKD